MGMELVLAMLIAYYLVRNTTQDLVYKARGEDPPSYRREMERIKRRQARRPITDRREARRFWVNAWEDAWESAHQRRERAHAQKRQARREQWDIEDEFDAAEDEAYRRNADINRERARTQPYKPDDDASAGPPPDEPPGPPRPATAADSDETAPVVDHVVDPQAGDAPPGGFCRCGLAGCDGWRDHVNRAGQLVVSERYGSASMLARRLGIPYDEAAEVLEELERRGVVGAAKPGGGSRDVLVAAGEFDTVRNIQGQEGRPPMPTDREAEIARFADNLDRLAAGPAQVQQENLTRFQKIAADTGDTELAADLNAMLRLNPGPRSQALRHLAHQLRKGTAANPDAGPDDTARASADTRSKDEDHTSDHVGDAGTVTAGDDRVVIPFGVRSPKPAQSTTETATGSVGTATREESAMTQPNGETTNLSAALAYTSGMADTCTEGVTSVETSLANLQAGEVGGRVIADLNQAMEALSQAAAAFQAAHGDLEQQLSVKEAYEATGNEAGSKQFVTQD